MKSNVFNTIAQGKSTPVPQRKNTTLRQLSSGAISDLELVIDSSIGSMAIFGGMPV